MELGLRMKPPLSLASATTMGISPLMVDEQQRSSPGQIPLVTLLLEARKRKTLTTIDVGTLWGGVLGNEEFRRIGIEERNLIQKTGDCSDDRKSIVITVGTGSTASAQETTCDTTKNATNAVEHTTHTLGYCNCSGDEGQQGDEDGETHFGTVRSV